MQELIDVEGDGMADMVFRCIQEMDIDNRMMVLMFFNCKISMWCILSPAIVHAIKVFFPFLFFFGSSTNTLSWVVGAQCILDYLVGKYIISTGSFLNIVVFLMKVYLMILLNFIILSPDWRKNYQTVTLILFWREIRMDWRYYYQFY